MEMESSDPVAGSRTWKQFFPMSWVFPCEAAVGFMIYIRVLIDQSFFFFFNLLASVGGFPLLRIKQRNKKTKKHKTLEANLVSQIVWGSPSNMASLGIAVLGNDHRFMNTIYKKGQRGKIILTSN